MMTDFVKFTKIYSNCSEVQNLFFEFQIYFFGNLRKSEKKNSLLHFRLIGDTFGDILDVI